MADWVFFVAYVAISVIMAGVSYYMASSYTPGEMQQDPLQALQTTTVREGTVVPIVYGTVRIAGNLLYYGGLKSQPHMEQTTGGGKGGGGGGSDTVQQGYDYYLNVWQGICMGKITLLSTVINDDPEKRIRAQATLFNDGTNGVYPTWIVGGALEATVILSGPGPAYSLGYTNIIKKTLAFSALITSLDKEYSVVLSLKDDGTGKIVSSAGTVMNGFSINYTTGILTCPSSQTLDMHRIDFYYKDNTHNPIDGESDPFYAGPLKGMAHIAYQQWHVGANVAHVPTIHFIVKRTLTSPVSYANMTNGTNPAAIIYDILTNTSYGNAIPTTYINLDTFDHAADYWYSMGYGMNFSVNSQMETSQLIEKILGWVGGSLYLDDEGRYSLHAFNPADAPSGSLEQDDFVELKITRKGWETTKNDLRFTYTDGLAAYTQRTFGLYDRANVTMQGGVSQATVDLTCFIDVPTVSKRAWEILKTSSYPGLVLTFKLLEASMGSLHVGKVVTISHAQYGFANAKFRITKIELGDKDNLEVGFTAEQMIEALVDATFGLPISPIPGWEPPIVTPLPLAHARIFELPWNPATLASPHYAMLGARAGHETSLLHYQSIVNGTSDFHYQTTTRRFSQYGTLDVAYNNSTHSIDDEVGIIYTPYRNDLDPPDVLRNELFLGTRFVLIGNELMAFQEHTPYGEANAFRLTGVLRGLFGTPIGSHALNAPVWIFGTYSVLSQISLTQTFWAKMVPATDSEAANAGDITAIAVTPAQKATAPPGINLIIATVNAGNFTATWLPCTRLYTGAGMAAEDAKTDSWPFDFDGDFEYKIGSGTPVNIAACTVTLAIAGNITFSVRQRVDAKYSAWLDVSIVNTNGTYLSEVGGIAY